MDMNSEGRETARTKLPGRVVSRRGGWADGGVTAPRRTALEEKGPQGHVLPRGQ